MAEDRDRELESLESPGSEEALEAEDAAKAAIYESVETNTGYEPDFEETWTAEHRLDLNSASEQELQALPGIGPELAAEIVAYRDAMGGFREAAEVTHVPGISLDLYERFADRVTAGGEEPEEYVVEEGQILPAEAAGVYDEPSPYLEEELLEEEPPVFEEPPAFEEAPPELSDEEEFVVVEEPLRAEEAPPPPPPPSRPVGGAAPPPRRGLGWGSLLLVGLLSALAGALLALLVVWLLNGTLDVQRAAERSLQGEVFRLEGDMEAIRAQMGGVEERITGVEGLAGDVEQAQGELRDLGSSVDTLSNDITAATRRLEDMQGTLAGLSDDMVDVEETVTTLGSQIGDVEARLGTMSDELAEAQEAVTRFDGFLTGLRELLSEEGATEAPGLATMTPMAGGPTGTATPVATATPRADVTVIPLATPTPTPTGQ